MWFQNITAWLENDPIFLGQFRVRLQPAMASPCALEETIKVATQTDSALLGDSEKARALR